MTEPLNLRHHTISFKHAWEGIIWTFTSQPNLRIHLFITALVVMAGWLLGLTAIEWLIIVFTVMWVLTAEMANTAVEAVVNLLTENYHPQAKIAKDVSAGMVLVGAMGAVVVGLVVFIPHLIKLLGI